LTLGKRSSIRTLVADQIQTKLRYVEAQGREPRSLPDDHPDAWQWAYRGTRAEREQMIAILGLDELEPAIVSEGQEELF